MKITTSAILAAYPPRGEAFYVMHAPFINKLIRLNLTTENDVLSTIWILCEELRLTLPELAKEIGVRKIDGVWCSVDPVHGHAISLADIEEQGFDLINEREEYTDEEQVELPPGVITNPRELANRLGVSVRRAQQIMQAKIADLKSGDDLFGLMV
ncbi:hypothetical protein CAP31_02665 [Sulfuriferula sp. AH1]|uniref:hypothetical protein n=1 Tax=Sulfuriferula sp. AH1 TaxID=1985873 RepID=UPI000B3B3A36|nr:hypothetical protein [Sulfuriferula sp. AH1]ARU30684.1 hypothetical protein CAP31_02665 [Sulfuriferula sp. AH1]